MNSQIVGIYGNKVRLRVCGICWKDNRLLVVKHKGLTNGEFWSLPGGGVEFGESIEEALKREFIEETGLSVEVGAFRFICEFVRPPLHAVELFFNVTVKSGTLKTGEDPELQIIEDVRYVDYASFTNMAAENVHGIVKHASSRQKFDGLQGFYRL